MLKSGAEDCPRPKLGLILHIAWHVIAGKGKTPTKIVPWMTFKFYKPLIISSLSLKLFSWHGRCALLFSPNYFRAMKPHLLKPLSTVGSWTNSKPLTYRPDFRGYVARSQALSQDISRLCAKASSLSKQLHTERDTSRNTHLN